MKDRPTGCSNGPRQAADQLLVGQRLNESIIMKTFKVAAIQMNALKDDLEHNLNVHMRFIQKAASANCQLVMFPELSVTAHYGDEKVVQFAQEAGNGPASETISAQAAKHDIEWFNQGL